MKHFSFFFVDSNMEDVKYDLDFYEALKVVMGGGAIKGEGFADGYFLRLSGFGDLKSLVIVDANDMYKEKDFVIYKNLSHQKFRELSVMTPKELSK